MKIILATFSVIHFVFACLGQAVGGDVQSVRMVYLLAVITGTAAVVLQELEKLRSEIRERDTSERQGYMKLSKSSRGFAREAVSKRRAA